MLNKYNNFFSYLMVGVVLYCLLSSTAAHAVNVFANGKPETYRDINAPGDLYFGAFDMYDPGATEVFYGPTSLTFNLGSQPNRVYAIVGAGLSGNGLRTVIVGNTNLTIRSTVVDNVCGGGLLRKDGGVNCEGHIFGTANIRLYDSHVKNLTGGCTDGDGYFDGSSVVGAVDILIDNSVVENLILTGTTDGHILIDGLGIKRKAVCVIQNGSFVQNMGCTATNADIGGDVSIDILGSKVERLVCASSGNIKESFSLHLGEYASKNAEIQDLELSAGGWICWKFLCTIDAGSIENVYSMPEGILAEARFVIGSKGSITNFMVDNPVTLDISGETKRLNIDIDGGTITNLDACAVRGSVGDFRINVKNQGTIENLTIGRANGSGQVGVIDALTVNLNGGTINTLAWKPLGTTTFTLRLSPGGANSIRNVSGSIDTLEVVSGSTTTIGTALSNTTLNVSDMSLAGTLIVPEGGTLTLNIKNSFVADGGTLSVMHQDGAVPAGPTIVLGGALTDGLTITNPLEIDGAGLTSFVNTGKIIPIAQANSAEFENPDLFEKKIQHQLLMGDIGFDPVTKVWSVLNLKPSNNYYGYTAGRKASSWLNQQAMQAVNTHSVKTILNKHEGLWVEGQGGMENLHATVGKSEMFWGMVSLGYDYHHAATEKVSGGYGVSIGVAGGGNKWREEDVIVGNRIGTLLGNCYAGYAYKGFYGVVGVQLAVCEVTSDNDGFETKRKWSDVMPMESFEFGWKYGVFEDLNIIPRAKVLLEQLSKRTVTFDAGQTKELLNFTAETTVSTIAGVAAEYNAKEFVGTDMTAQLGLDWIRGIDGSYAVHSKVLNVRVEEKNKNDVLRVTLGGDLPLGEALRVGVQIFGDVLDNTGFGAQATVGYMF